MGLFSFLKDVGEKVFDKKDTPAPKNEPTPAPRPEANFEKEMHRQKVQLLHNVVMGLNVDIDDLQIDLQGDTVHVSGEVDAQADREKVILALGNVSGIASVQDDIRVVKPEPEAIFHEVKKGDTLSKIAKKYYGDPMRYPEIFEANKPMLKSADLIYPGQVLRIPQA
jgi:nucleoid-associated protein YgaU